MRDTWPREVITLFVNDDGLAPIITQDEMHGRGVSRASQAGAFTEAQNAEQCRREAAMLERARKYSGFVIS